MSRSGIALLLASIQGIPFGIRGEAFARPGLEMTSSALDTTVDGKYGRFLTMGNAGCLSSTVSSETLALTTRKLNGPPMRIELTAGCQTLEP